MIRRIQPLICLRNFGVCIESLPTYATLTHTATLTSERTSDSMYGSFETHDLATPVFDGQAVPEQEQLLLQAAVVGVPNSGKSTLVNSLVGQKVSAVSHKTNTTAYTRLGAFTEGCTQVLLYDTPGVVDSRHYKNPRHERRVKSAWTAAADCDLLLLLIDAHRQLIRPDPRVERLIRDYGTGANLGLNGKQDWDPPQTVLVMNKVDAVPRNEQPKLIPAVEKLRALCVFDEVFWISALHGHGMGKLREYLVGRAIPGAWTVEPDAVTDRSDEELALEVVREYMFRRYNQEVPYQTQVVPISFKFLRDGSLRIEHHIFVTSEGVKKIVVGKQGTAIGFVGKNARETLERMWKTKIHLILYVKVIGSKEPSAEP